MLSGAISPRSGGDGSPGCPGTCCPYEPHRRPSPARHSGLLLGGLQRGRQCRRRDQSAALEPRGRDRVPRRGGDRCRGPVDQHAGGALRGRRGGENPRAPRQRVPRRDQARPARSVWWIRLATAARCRWVARPACVRARCARARRRFADDQRRRQLSGRRRFDPIFAELQRRAAVVFVHPTASPDPIAHTLGLPDALLDYPVDTSRAIAKLHYSNTFARTPDVKYMFSHAGGTIPFLASRFGIVDAMDVIPGAEERGRSPTRFPGSTGTPPRRSAIPCSTCCAR